jgi:hypothetical protein
VLDLAVSDAERYTPQVLGALKLKRWEPESGPQRARGVAEQLLRQS